MGQGLQVWKGGGVNVFDTTYNTSRLLGTIQVIGSNGTTGYVDDARFATGRPFYMVSPKTTGSSPYGFPYVPTFGITIQGTRLTWTVYTSGVNQDCGTILYGVY